MNKREAGTIQQYKWSITHYGIRGIMDAYKDPSGRKVAAYESIKARVADQKGVGLTVIGGSCFQFSTGYVIPDKNLFVHDTAYNLYEIKLTDEQKDELVRLIKEHGVC